MIRLGLDYQRNCAMVQYDSIDSARKALEAVKGAHIGSSKKLMVRCVLNFFSIPVHTHVKYVFNLLVQSHM